jgi:hypothetical protein
VKDDEKSCFEIKAGQVLQFGLPHDDMSSLKCSGRGSITMSVTSTKHSVDGTDKPVPTIEIKELVGVLQ